MKLSYLSHQQKNDGNIDLISLFFRKFHYLNIYMRKIKKTNINSSGCDEFYFLKGSKFVKSVGDGDLHDERTRQNAETLDGSIAVDPHPPAEAPKSRYCQWQKYDPSHHGRL
jgi:hypothetical protein